VELNHEIILVVLFLLTLVIMGWAATPAIRTSAGK
jgi:hypothetical protein